eukprot:SM000213S06832  [mRNA]  locus=s213:120475:131093:- [translate_table: standard]
MGSVQGRKADVGVADGRAARLLLLLLLQRSLAVAAAAEVDNGGSDIVCGGTLSCGAAATRGRRLTQEDRAVCLPSLTVLPPHHDGLNATSCSACELHYHAVYDGHNGQEAVDFVAAHLHHRFAELANARLAAEGPAANGEGLRSLLRHLLLAAFADVNAALLEVAQREGWLSGSTACVALFLHEAIDGGASRRHLLTANLGDSRALLCTRHLPPLRSTLTSVGKGHRGSRLRRAATRAAAAAATSDLQVVELTTDHAPDHPDERCRIEAGGGRVLRSSNSGGPWRVDGRLAVSRAFGDLEFRDSGVIAVPEVPAWREIAASDVLLALVCDSLTAGHDQVPPSGPPGDSDTMLQPAIPLPPPEMYTAERDSAFGSETFSTATPESDVLGTACSCNAGLKHCNPESVILEGVPDNSDADGKIDAVDQLTRAPCATQQLAELLCRAALQGQSMDNVAAVVVDLQPRFTEPGLNKGLNACESTNAVALLPDVIATAGTNAGSDIALSVQAGPLDGLKDIDSSNGEGRLYYYQLLELLSEQAALPSKATRQMEPIIATTGPVCGAKADLSSRKAVVSLLPSVETPSGRSTELAAWVDWAGWLVCLRDGDTDNNSKHAAALELATCRTRHMPHMLARLLGALHTVPFELLQLGSAPRAAASGSTFFVQPTPDHQYVLKKFFAAGAFGEVWLAARREMHGRRRQRRDGDQESSGPEEQSRTEGGSAKGRSGLREKHFGETLWNGSLTTMLSAASSEELDQSNDNLFDGLRGRHGMAGSFTRGKASRKSRPYAPSRGESHEQLDEDLYEPAGESYKDGQEEACGDHPARENGLSHIARYVESFTQSAGRDLWLVFRNEGQSLTKLLYTAPSSSSTGGLQLVRTSPTWQWLKTTAPGQEATKLIMRHLLLALETCHVHNITHRDVKPENMIVSSRFGTFFGHDGQEIPEGISMRLADFGSAVDQHATEHLYGSHGPSSEEETVEYSPPEVLLSPPHLHAKSIVPEYDIWSAGVVMLELALGTPHVFEVTARTRALLDQKLSDLDASSRTVAHLLRALMELCILVPMQHLPQYQHWRETHKDGEMATWQCTEEALLHQLQQRDTLGLGIGTVWALRLLRRLLQWRPEDRISASQALRHAYFRSDPGGYTCEACGQEFEFSSEAQLVSAAEYPYKSKLSHDSEDGEHNLVGGPGTAHAEEAPSEDHDRRETLHDVVDWNAERPHSRKRKRHVGVVEEDDWHQLHCRLGLKRPQWNKAGNVGSVHEGYGGRHLECQEGPMARPTAP